MLFFQAEYRLTSPSAALFCRLPYEWQIGYCLSQKFEADVRTG